MAETAKQLTAAEHTFNQFDGVLRRKSPATRALYHQALHYYMDYLQIPRDSYDKLVAVDPKHIQMDICNFIESLGNRGLSYATIATYAGAIKKFYDQNDIITLNWKKIRGYLPDHERTVEDRPYTHSEITTLLASTNVRNRGIILVMASGGLRLGAIPGLRMKDLEANDDYGIYKITVYPFSVKSHYTTWCTPEARKTIEEYIATRRRWGERITDDSPVFRIDYNIYKTATPKPITTHGIRDFMGALLLRTGLRRPPTEGITRRLEVMMDHGYRKFFETNAYRAGMDEEYIRRLQGHKRGGKVLSDAYNKIEEQELLEGDSKHVGYAGIIDQLTISNEHKLTREIQTLRIEKSKMDMLENRIEELDNILGKFMDQ